VETHPNEAVVMVKSVQGHGLPGDILVKVSLTSPVVREEQLAAAAATGGAANGTAPSGTVLFTILFDCNSDDLNCDVSRQRR